MKYLLSLLLIIAAAVLWLERDNLGQGTSTPASSTELASSSQARYSSSPNNQRIYDLFAQRRSGILVEGVGTVTRVLPDDNDGSRHQRFILSIGNGHTLLIAHNIDLAPRIPNLREGDQITFSGQYEYNNKGGVVHWTHHDPRRKRAGGWLEKNGYRYK